MGEPALCIRCHTRPALGLVCDPCLIAGRQAEEVAPRAGATPCHDPAPGGLLPFPAADRGAAGPSEAVVQHAGVTALRQAGWQVWRIGQRNAKGTQDAGVPDAVAMRAGRMAWLEFKRPVGGRQSDAQRAFEQACVAAGVPYLLVRDVADLAPLLTP